MSIYRFGLEKATALTAVLAFFISTNAVALEDSLSVNLRNVCQPKWIANPVSIPEQSTLPNVEADAITQPGPEQYRLTGHVIVKQPGTVLISDEILLNRSVKTAEAFGHVELHQKEVITTGQYALMDDGNAKARLEKARFQFKDTRSHGQAATLDIDRNDRQAFLSDASYTTCKLQSLLWKARNGEIEDEPYYPWELEFDRLRIDDAKRRIYGRNTWLYFQNVPIFYTPYFNFPMDNRATGFLFPEFGSYKSISKDHSEGYVSIPYYVNLAPDYDDTITTTFMERRGVVLSNEFRYVQPKHQAVFTTHYLSDNITAKEGIAYYTPDGTVYYTDPVRERWSGHVVASQNWTQHTYSYIDWREISDENFYADVPINPELDTDTYVARQMNLNYNKNDFHAHLTLLDYLRLRRSNIYNYEKRPEVAMDYSHYFEDSVLENVTTNLTAEATKFEISYSGHQKPEALRTYVSPSADYSIYKPYGHFRAEMVVNQVTYQMADNGYNNTGADSHENFVPQYALNAGLNFERNFSAFGRSLIQTLEPEVQYLYVPYRDQSNLPVFDTTERSLDFSNLFSYNRFSGYDRIGDANQIAAALTTRFLKPDGEPLAEAGIGQIFYFEDRKVRLPDSQSLSLDDTSSVSDYFVKLGVTLNPVSLYSTNQFSHTDGRLTNSNTRAKLDLSPRFTFLVANIATNLNRPDETKDLAAGFYWKMNDKWSLGNYWNYDFIHDRKSEVSTALRYDSCCWASELSLKEEQLGNGLYNYSVQYLIELKGLSSAGTPFSNYLREKLNF